MPGRDEDPAAAIVAASRQELRRIAERLKGQPVVLADQGFRRDGGIGGPASGQDWLAMGRAEAEAERAARIAEQMQVENRMMQVQLQAMRAAMERDRSSGPQAVPRAGAADREVVALRQQLLQEQRRAVEAEESLRDVQATIGQDHRRLLAENKELRYELQDRDLKVAKLTAQLAAIHGNWADDIEALHHKYLASSSKEAHRA
mmetsp:Transcript_43208/g.122174  ORF Transcript_43208/g.122174 Transcript_43208/m.122174 type:complete len:203 (+) Transcript_43208:60-668(+)